MSRTFLTGEGGPPPENAYIFCNENVIYLTSYLSFFFKYSQGKQQVNIFSVLVLCTQVNMMFVMLL